MLLLMILGEKYKVGEVEPGGGEAHDKFIYK
jgi:hypothetical protein